MDWPTEYELVLRDHLPGLDPAEPVTEALVLGDCGLDSFGTVSLLVALEDELEIRFPNELLSADTFATAGALWNAIQQARADLATN